MRTRLVSTTLVAAALVVGCSSGGGGSPTSRTTATATSASATPAPTAPLASTSMTAGATAAGSSQAGTIDQAFIDMMVPHHQSAIEMAKLAKDKAEHQELRGLADTIITAQEGEISQLKGWRSAWFGSDSTPAMDAMPLMPGMDPGMGGHAMNGATMDMTADVDKLKTADPFDGAFLDAMTAHHESAIEAANIALGETQRPEVKKLAQDIVEAQQAEIDQMKAWRATWYPAP